ncbi:MAG TPA: penicillin acylase family protein [Anaerolineales bacterium]
MATVTDQKSTAVKTKRTSLPRILGRILIWLVSILLIASILFAAFGVYTVRSSFPQVSGEIHLAGLNGPIEIYRTSLGIPQVYASTQHDLFFAQGYVHAQDRFWQMDFWRHIGSGRLAEMFGKSELKTDQFLRTLGWARVAQQELDNLDPNTKAILQAYADGVNAYLADHKGSALSLEYAILKLLTPGYQVENWTPLNTMTWAKVMAWDLSDQMGSEIQRSILLNSLTPEQVNELLPPFPSDHPVIVPTPNTTSAKTNPLSNQDTALAAALGPALQALASRSASLDALLGPHNAGIGSNNWVISGKRTSTGKPLLANDPHLGAQMPSIWYEIGLYCAPKGPDCPFEVTGFSFAGAPGVIIGHNDRVAWGFTNVGPDVQDLFIEKINPNNPNQYEHNGKWEDMQLVQETLKVGGGSPVDLTVRYTRHGPIVSDTFGDLKDFGQKAGLDKVGVQVPAQYALALRWTALEPGSVFRAIWKFDAAQNWDEFRQAATFFVVPAQNLVYADVDGNIGYQTPGNIPIRAKGDGTLPVPGWTDEYDWTGYIPFEKLPFAFNPPQGYIATANNAVVGPDYPYLITKDWDYGFRAARIVDMIEQSPGPITIEYIKKMQSDNKDLNAEALSPVLLQVPLNDARLEKARTLLQNWDYQDFMDSAPAALFAVFWKHLLSDTFNNKLPEAYWPDGGDRWFEVLRQLVQQPDSKWWDNPQTPAVETRDQVFKQALGEAVDELEKVQGSDQGKWNWGSLHTITFRNQSLGKSGVAPIEALFNRGPFRTSGGSSIVNATGWESSKSYEVRSLPSMRMIVDLSNLQNSLTIHTTGESGHAYHPNYIDMANLWRLFQYQPMLWDRSQIESGASAHLRLLP